MPKPLCREVTWKLQAAPLAAMMSYSLQICGLGTILVNAFVPPRTTHRHGQSALTPFPNVNSVTTSLSSSPLDDFLGGIFGNNNEDKEKIKSDKDNEKDEEEMSLSSFRQELAKRQISNDDSSNESSNEEEGDEEFSGYDLRDIIYAKYGECFDVEFQRVDSYGFRSVYLNIMPFRLGGKRFRHETEYDYLCHLQAVVEILVKYNQLDSVISQLMETTKKPRAGTSPLVAVPLRLNLTPEQVDKILG